jgi:hypothetical protein
MSSKDRDQCCPRFDPAAWDGKEIRWQEKRFVKDRVTSFLHIPLNFGGVMKRNMSRIEAAGAGADTNVILSDSTQPAQNARRSTARTTWRFWRRRRRGHPEWMRFPSVPAWPCRCFCS